ncbi:MAG: MFS transporter, partial [Maritimibacter sp.]
LALAFALSAASPSLLALSGAQALAGMAAGVVLPATYGLAAQVAAKGRESQTLGKVLIGWTLSFVAGVSLSALLADLVHWRAVYLALAVLALGLAVGLVPLARRVGRADGRRLSLWQSLRLEGVAPLLLSQVLFMAAFYGLYAYLGPHLTGPLGLSTALTGFAAPLDRLLDRLGPTRVAPGVFLILIVAYSALAIWSASALALIALCMVWGAVNHLGLNLLVGQLNAASSEHRASVMALNSAFTYGAMLLGTSGFKPLFEAYGFTGCALLSAALILPVTLIALRSARPNTAALSPNL